MGRKNVERHKKVELIRRSSVYGYQVDTGKTLREFR